MRLDRAVDDGEVLAVVERVQHADLQRGGLGDRGLARFKIDLHAKRIRKALQPLGQTVQADNLRR